jgi:hypothetical protein
MQSAPPQPAQLSELAGTLRRRWRVLALGAVVGLLLGVLAWVLLPVTYTATTSVRVVPVDVSPSSGSSPTLDVATDAQLVTSGDVLTAAADDLDTSAGALKSGVSVTNPPDTAVLDIAYTASTPRAAAAGSRAVAEAFLTVRGEAAAKTVQELQEATWDRIDMLEDSADRYPEDSPARESILTEAKTLGTRAAELATVDTSPGRVLGAPATPSAPSSLGVLPLGVAGLALGLLVAVPVALTRRDRAPDPGVIATAQDLGSTQGSAVLDGTADASPQDTWDVAALMLDLPATAPADGPVTLLVDGSAGTESGEGLAEALRRRGLPVRHVDASALLESKIARGWPTDRKKATWAGELVVIDSSALASDALVATLGTRVDHVVLARSVDDDAVAARRVRSLLAVQGVDVALTVLLPRR